METERRRATSGPGTVVAAAAIDLACVCAFAAAGRNSHAESVDPAGVWQTAWPFAFALAVTWILALVWRRATAILRSGVPVWVGTVTLGLILRVLFTDGGAAPPFVLVATGVLGVTLVGWRALFAAIRALAGRTRGLGR